MVDPTPYEVRLIASIGESTEHLTHVLKYFPHRAEPLNLDTWSQSSTHRDNCVDILYLSSGKTDEHTIQIVEEAPKPNPLLVVGDSAGITENSKLVNCCDDFVIWPCSQEELRVRIGRLSPEVAWSEKGGEGTDGLECFIGLQLLGRSPAFLQILTRIKQFARFDTPVLIEGETGTGKELVARALHYLGNRQDHPFIPINCGAIPDTLFENELYGHSRGAYTDAFQTYSGLVEQAEKGTLFLDEVEALSAKGQVVLLRFLQDMVYKPLGGKTSKKANLRVIAASNQSLSQLVDKGRFRQDLYFRLNVLTLTLPPLRERLEDIILLAEYFLDKYCKEYGQPAKRFQQNSLLWMQRYSWPGNVRELENVIHRGFVLSNGELIDVSRVGIHRQGPDRRQNTIDRRTHLDMTGGLGEVKQRVVEYVENAYLRDLLTKTHGNITKAAQLAGKERRALGKLLKKYMIDRNSFCKY